jgi:HSP20 family protein
MHEYFHWLTNIDTVHRELGRLLDHFGSSKPPRVVFAPGAWEPAIDIYDREEEIVVVAELAGVSPEIEVVVESNTLVIRGERRETSSGFRYYQMEIAKGPFERGILLPTAVDAERVQVSYENGLLYIVLPKIQERRTHKVKIITRSQ